jgi:uncharacterized membrane protein
MTFYPIEMIKFNLSKVYQCYQFFTKKRLDEKLLKIKENAVNK